MTLNNLNKIKIILKRVQINKASHQKNLKVLEDIYNTVEQEVFMHYLSQCMRNIFMMQNEYTERTFDFLAQFVSNVTSANDTVDIEWQGIPTHSFLTAMVLEILKYNNVISEAARFNSCLYLRLILQHIGTKTQLDNGVCDLIQDAMLERTMDPKPTIRHQAIMSLVRLQDPLNQDCPVINAYMSLIVDANPLIRAEVVKVLAPYNITIPLILKRIQDIDTNVRIMAFRRCADIGPKSFKIVERQHILRCGLNEKNSKVHGVFINNLLVKWLRAYDQNCIDFIKALKLDADEKDIISTEKISKDIMNLIFSSVSMSDIIGILPINDEKLIPVQNLTSESVTVWNATTAYMRQSSDCGEYLEQILPELKHFCSHIQGYIKFKKPFTVEDWQHLEYQEVLYNLFEILEGYDFSDEVGRKSVIELCQCLIKDESLHFRLLKNIIKLGDHLKSTVADFTTNICHIISEIREPLTEKVVVSQPETRNSEFEIARLKVQITTLECQLEEATSQKQFLEAHSVEQQILKLREKLSQLSAPVQFIELTKVSKDDPKTICRCLDILIALLELPSIKVLTPSLVAVKDEFVLPLLDYNAADVNWRVLNCLSLLCIIDDTIASEYVKVLSLPILTYRAITNYNKLALMTSVKAISDMFRIYGISIFGGGITEGVNGCSNITNNSMNLTRRRLYRNDYEDNSLIDPNRFQFESIFEIMLDMLDDENCSIRECSVIAITKLIRSNFPVTPPLITRMILKWYNPLTAKASDNLQQILGGAIGNYAHHVKGAKDVIAKAVIPIINAVASAPKTSPLADIDVDNLLKFLSVLTNAGNNTNLVDMHLNIAHMLCHEILKKKISQAVPYLTKMLLQLEISTANLTAIQELMNQVEIVLDEITDLDRLPLKNLKKFLTNLQVIISNYKNIPEESNVVDTVGEIMKNHETTDDGNITEAQNSNASFSIDQQICTEVITKTINNEKNLRAEKKLPTFVQINEGIEQLITESNELNNSTHSNTKECLEYSKRLRKKRIRANNEPPALSQEDILSPSSGEYSNEMPVNKKARKDLSVKLNRIQTTNGHKNLTANKILCENLAETPQAEKSHNNCKNKADYKAKNSSQDWRGYPTQRNLRVNLDRINVEKITQLHNIFFRSNCEYTTLHEDTHNKKNIPNKNRRISERLRSRNFSTSNSENSEASLDIPREAVLRRIRDENVQILNETVSSNSSNSRKSIINYSPTSKFTPKRTSSTKTTSVARSISLRSGRTNGHILTDCRKRSSSLSESEHDFNSRGRPKRNRKL